MSIPRPSLFAHIVARWELISIKSGMAAGYCGDIVVSERISLLLFVHQSLLFINTYLFTVYTCLCTVSFNKFHISHYYLLAFSTP